jgi:hypothetical protein
MMQMATGEAFMRIHHARRNAEKRASAKKIDKESYRNLRCELVALQTADSALWADLTLSDDFVEQNSKEYNSRIQELINAIY